ncbi:MAG: hypothetical protein Q8K68_13380 [Nitrospirota bacterium]|nr:hypothetical protein [Nitrospirota bacterium]
MKLTLKLLVLSFCVLLLTNFAYAESPREQLKQMVEQLQKNPTDNGLHKPPLLLLNQSGELLIPQKSSPLSKAGTVG